MVGNNAKLLHSSKELDESFSVFILKTMPLAVMIVNSDVRVQGINEAAQEFLCIFVTQIQGLIPICSLCHCIRDDQGEWHSLQNYLKTHSEAELTHDFCPISICSKKSYDQHTQNK